MRDNWSDSYSITITNIGYRPITLIGLSVDSYQGSIPNRVMRHGYEDEKPTNWNFPVTLSDGDHISISLPEIVSRAMYEEDFNKIIVFDAEGNSYDKYKKISYDSKYGLFSKIK